MNNSIIECNICMEVYNQINAIPYICNPCGHTFCKKCLDNRYKYNNLCPICKTIISSITINRELLKLDFIYIDKSNDSISKIKNDDIKNQCLLILKKYLLMNNKCEFIKTIRFPDLQSYFMYIKQCCDYIESITISNIKLDCYMILHLKISQYYNENNDTSLNKQNLLNLQNYFMYIKQCCDYIESIFETNIKK